MAIAGPDLRWIRVNAALGELLGREPSDLVGRCALDLTHPDDRAISVSLHDGVIAGSQPAPLEKRLMHRDGSAIPVLLTTALIDGEDGMHFFTQLQDLRDRHRADRFSQAVAELSRVALELPDVPALMRQVVEIVQEAAGADSCGVVMTRRERRRAASRRARQRRDRRGTRAAAAAPVRRPATRSPSTRPSSRTTSSTSAASPPSRKCWSTACAEG